MLNVPKAWIREDIQDILRIIVVPSRSVPGKEYYVSEHYEDGGRLSCSCPAYQYRGDCSHINMLKAICTKPARKHGVQDTSKAAYKNYNPAKMSARRRAIYDYLRKTPTCDRLGAKALGYTINFYTGARNALTKDYDPPLIELKGYMVDVETEERVIVWGATDRRIELE